MMKKLKPITVNVEGLISANKYCVDESNRHIELAAEDLTTLPAEEFGKLVRVCPAALYKAREASITLVAWSAAPAASPARAPS